MQSFLRTVPLISNHTVRRYAQQKQERDLFKIIIQNFLKSIRPRKFEGTLMGEDYHGNRYFEIAADPANGRRKVSRYFEPREKNAFDQELTAEWEAWLRGRRQEPPTDQELIRNLAIMKLKQKNAKELDVKHGKNELQEINAGKPEVRGFESFPTYGDEYEISAGYQKKKPSE